MSVARHHAEWLSLVETSGPFLSMPVLLRAFPQGLDGRDSDRAARLRETYEEWLDRKQEPAVHRTWVQHVLRELLEYPPELLVEGQSIPPGLEAAQPLFGETLRPDWVLKHRDPEGRPQLLISLYPSTQKLDGPVAGKVWKEPSGTRMMELLHATDVPLGLVTNGEHWMLVHAPRGETTGFASWYADLWMQEPITLRAFQSLLDLRRFLGVAADETLPALFAASSKDQQEVTDQLGYQVRRAVEMLVQAFDRIDAESGRQLLSGMPEKELYDGALTVMMRLVFLFSAEERKLLLLGDPLYDQHYAVSTLSELLRERADQHGEEVLERRHDAWCRLLATFRAVYAGVQHEAMRLPAYGGTLFDPDRYPFLEGRTKDTKWTNTAAKPLPINNRVVLHLLESLQFLRVKVPGGGPAEARRLSFRALGIEEIGHVYEGLLDHTAKRAPETILGLSGAKDKEPEIPLSKLEELAAKGTADLIEYLHEETGKSENGLKGLLKESPEIDEHALLIACGQDARLLQRVKPFAALLREDSFGQFVVIPEGSVYVTRGSERRSTGTHYTPRSLTKPIVQYTLEPLVYIGPAEGKPEEEWQLKSPKELLELKVCDMAMGSGAFLVQACRYLAERLVEAWEKTERANPGKILATPEGDFSAGDPKERLIPADPDERVAIAQRTVADRCLYGVDINPMAVEMAKLSLWLITLQRDRPFTFLDHALKCGDSLLGVSSVQQIENFSLRPGERQVTFATVNLFRYVDEASAKRRALEDLPSNDHTQIETKNRLHAEAEAATAKVKTIADCLIAFELLGLDGDAYEEQRTDEAEKVQLLMKRDADASLKSQSPTINQLSAYAREQLRGRRPFHWAVEFPEVFARGGFGAFVGNPPFIKGHFISQHFGDEYRTYLAERIHGGSAGLSDLCAFFVRQAFRLLSDGGCAGLIATNTISEGDTRKVGLDSVQELGGAILRADPDIPWFGDAAVIVSPLVMRKGSWLSKAVLSGHEVESISSRLQAGVNREVMALLSNNEKAFVGSYLLGDGYVLTPEEARAYLQSTPDAQTVILPYINGVEFNAFPNLQPRRFAICFWDWTLSRVRTFPELAERIESLVKPVRDGVDRDRNRDNWWLHAENRPGLYHAVGLGNRFLKHTKNWNPDARFPNRVVVKAKTSDTWAFGFLPSTTLFDQALTVIASDDIGLFGVLQSTLHEIWARESGAGSKMKLDQRYSASMFETFPFPASPDGVARIGSLYDDTRREIMETRQEGLTKTYNRFHDRGEQSEDIARLRALHVEMDQAVAATYGWNDLDLGHGFHETKQGVRYTISESVRRIVLDRLLALNHERYEEEVRAGLHEKKVKGIGPRQRGRKKAALIDTGSSQSGLFEKVEVDP